MKKYYFSTNLKYLREKNNIEQLDLAESLGRKSASAVSEWEKGLRVPDVGTLDQISNIFNISINDLMKKNLYERDDYYENASTQRLDDICMVREEDKKYQSSDLKISPVKIPILGSVPAGIPIEAIENIIGYEEIHPDMAKRGSYFALQIKGDSMLPVLQEDDIVIVREQPDVESGDIAVIFNGDNEATVKQIKKEDNGIWIIPFNDDHAFKKRFYHYEDENNFIKIVGKVVEQRRRF